MSLWPVFYGNYILYSLDKRKGVIYNKTMTNTLDIRDINPGETYYAIASSEKGGRCILNGMFIAAWTDKAEAKAVASGNSDYTVVKCRKPEVD